MVAMARSPRYLQLAAELRQQIALGDVGPDGILDSEAELSRRSSVSRVTVRKALAQLQREGLVVSRQGSGWYTAPPLQNALGIFPTEPLAHEAAGGTIQRRALDTKWTTPPAPVRALLDLGARERALRVRRVISADGVPYDLVTTWLPAELGHQTSGRELQDTGAWAVFKRLGVEPIRTEQTIGAALATRGDAALLEAEEPLALLLLRRVGYLDDGRAVAVSDHRYPSGRVRLSVSFPAAYPLDSEPPGRELLTRRRTPDTTTAEN